MKTCRSMPRARVGLFAALLMLSTAYGQQTEQTNVPPIEILRVLPNKVRYLPGEQGRVQVTLRNNSITEQAAEVAGDMVQELARVTPLAPQKVTLPARKETAVEILFTAPTHEYGAAVRVRALQDGAVRAQAQDAFAVARSVWPVAIGAHLTMMDMSGRPWQDPPKDIKIARERYFNWWEKMFWPPDDWGDMTPTGESWFSGQGGRYEVKKVLKEFTALARSNGIASVTYGKSTGGGPAGWEIARQHPDWFTEDAAGRIVGTYDTDLFARWDSLPRYEGRPWHYLYPNLSRLDALDHGIDEILNSALDYGWDGVRFDGDFTWVASDAVAARNQRRMKERIWAKLPDFVFGFNEGFGPADSDPATWSHGLREGLAGGGHWMNEGVGNNDFGYASNGRYTSFRAYWEHESAGADRLRQIGASYHFIYYLPKESRGLYKFILGTSAGAHPVYGESADAPGCTNWGRFLTRWSAFVWDVNLRNASNAEAQVSSAAPLWHAVKTRVADAGTAMTVVHLIVPPSTDDCHDPKVQVGPPAAQVAVRVRVPAGETVVRAAAIAPEQPDEALDLPVTREGEWVAVTVPSVKTWTMLVIERSGKYTVPVYRRFTEPPDPKKVQEGVEAGVGKLMRDPLRPEASSEVAGKIRVLEMENLYQTHAKVEPDKDASGGYCTRIDYTMANSSVISHAIYSSVTPGRYRATYRLKLKSKTDDAGKAIWAGFGLFVMLGEKQVWLKEIGPNDFRTPGQYEDFPVEFAFLGEGSTINVSAFWRGQQSGGTVYADKITLEQLAAFTDQDIAAIEKKQAGAATGGSVAAQTRPGGDPGLDVLVVNGLYAPLYRLPEALAQLGPVKEIPWKPAPAVAPASPDSKSPDAELLIEIPDPKQVRVKYCPVSVGDNSAQISGYPATYADLSRYDLVVLINADATWLRFPGRAALRQFVAAGGSLLVLGGNMTLGQGGFAGTFLADMLPVTVAEARDVQHVPAPLRPLSAGLSAALPRDLWKPTPYVFWQHRAALKPGAQVQMTAGKEPVLITGAFEKGRVAVFTGTVLGVPAGKEQPFWDWKVWPPLLATTVRWLDPRAEAQPEPAAPTPAK